MRRQTGRKLLVATRNPGKISEYRALLAGIPFQLTCLVAEGVSQEVEETGSTFQENARTKAEAYAALAGLLTLADDSGLEVDALGGAPGVHSARYGGPGLSDEQRVRHLLHELRGVPWDQRGARFRCVIAIAGPARPAVTVEGVVEGIIQYEPKGANGFGYDPVFYLPDLGATTAELPPDKKNSLSHRGAAARRARVFLAQLVSKKEE